MIDDIAILYSDKRPTGKQLNDIVDQFRDGRDVGDIILLVDSGKVELVVLGSYILNEVNCNVCSTPPIIRRLHHLTKHQSAEVRFYALGALFPSLSSREKATIDLLERMMRDANAGVRSRAQLAADRLGIRPKSAPGEQGRSVTG